MGVPEERDDSETCGKADGDAPHAPQAPVRADWLHAYVVWLQRWKLAVVAFWIALLVVGIIGVTRVFPALRLLIDPIPGDANDVARQALAAAMPWRAKAYNTWVVLRSSDNASPVASLPAARAASASVSAFAAPYIASGLLSTDSGASYFSYADAGLAPLAASVLSADKTAQLIRLTTTKGLTVDAEFQDFLEALRDTLGAALRAAGGTLSGDVTGELVINWDSSSAILNDIAVSDAITVSLSFALLACALRSPRLILLALAALIAAFGGAFLLIWPLVGALSTPNFTTSLVISTLVSLSLDYSLFLLTHLRDSARAGMAIGPAVEAMLRSSGHTVLVSGATLASCFLVLAVLPVSIVRSPGIATTLAVVNSVAASLSLTPALLLLYPGFFTHGTAEGTTDCSGGCCARRRGGKDAHADGTINGDSSAGDHAPPPPNKVSSLLLSKLAAADAWSDRTTRRVWSLVALHTRRHKYALTIGLTALLVAPFAPWLPKFETSQSLRNIAPRGEPSIETLLSLSAPNLYGVGFSTPASLLGVVSAPPPATALTPAFFASAAAAVAAVTAASAPGAVTGARGLALDPSGSGAAANASVVAASLAAAAACPSTSAAACVAACPPAACMLVLNAASTLSSDKRAMLLTLGLGFRREGKVGVEWSRAARAALASVNATSGGAVTWSLQINAIDDSVAYVYSHFGELVGITAAVVFVILAVAFQSLAISLRAVLTLAAMEIAVFGAASAIYCTGLLDPGGVLQTFDGATGLFWLMPILAFSLTTGLGLDYDVFLLTSIVEERLAGWSDEDAIAIGLQRSGPVISWAGAIMAVAYGGFLFSDIPLLQQLGFFIVFAVLIDTFIVRPLLVPSIMCILGQHGTYWPRRNVPVPTRGPLTLLAADDSGVEAADVAAAAPAGDVEACSA